MILLLAVFDPAPCQVDLISVFFAAIWQFCTHPVQLPQAVGYLSSSALCRSWDIAATYQACTQILTSYSLTATLSASSWKVPGLVHHPGLLCWLDQFPIELFQASCQQNQTHKLTCHLNWNVTVWWMRFGINSVLSSISEFSIYKLKSTQFILKFQSR